MRDYRGSSREKIEKAYHTIGPSLSHKNVIERLSVACYERVLSGIKDLTKVLFGIIDTIYAMHL